MNWQGAKIHLIGIGGTGLSAIARLLLESGCQVSGSDRQPNPQTESLQSAGVRIHLGHQPANVHGAEIVVRSSAIPDNNPEVIEAQRLGIPVLKRADFLGQLMQNRIGIAIAGSHGKTTTTSMIAWMLTALNLDPSYIIGGVPANLGVNAHAGAGPHFVIEADEYDRMFHGLNPQIAVITNIEHDHPDCYPTAADYQDAFLTFARRLPPTGALLLDGQDPGNATLAAALAADPTRPHILSYTAPSVIASDLYPSPAQQSLPTAYCLLPTLHLTVPGEHNRRNAQAALAVAQQLGLDLNAAAQALNNYSGAERRFQLIGQANGITVINDYAHHPTEIRATLAAARQRYPGQRLWAVWQPHTYSRTQTLYHQFAGAFHDADRIIVTEIYPSRELPPPDGYSAAPLAAAIAANFAPDLAAARRILLAELQPGDILIILTAGDADQLCQQVLTHLTTGGPA